MVVLSVKDENLLGKVLSEVSVEFNSENLTIQEVIEARVRHEVDNYNKKQPEYYNGLIEPTDAEKTINGYKLRNRKPIDSEKQVYTALDAFQKNGFFVLVDNQQCTSLNQVVKLIGTTNICFVKLTQLVGG